VPKEWADKYAGRFGHGWDEQRRLTWERQKELGVIPAGTQLTPRPDAIPAWNDCSDDERRVYARMQEVFAGFLEHVDAQVGRIVDAMELMGLRENTLIVYMVGDNGPSAEGSLTGTLNNMKSHQGYPDEIATMLSKIDEIGSARHEHHYPVGWCWAGSSPFQWMKQVASHFGGTRNPGSSTTSRLTSARPPTWPPSTRASSVSSRSSSWPKPPSTTCCPWTTGSPSASTRHCGRA